MIEQTLKCDILGRRATNANPIRRVRIRVEVEDVREDESSWSTDYMTELVDMCPDARARAIKFAKRAVSPPNIAATRAAEAEAKGDAKQGG